MKPLLFLLFLSAIVSFNAAAQDVEYGKASYYSDEFQGRKTAYGDVYDKNQMTCAHKRHPYGTVLVVTRLDNNRSVRVRVIDKGPFIKGRVVDLSGKAAEQLGLTDGSAVDVKVEVAGSASSNATAANSPATSTRSANEAPRSTVPTSYDEPAPTPPVATTPAPAPATPKAAPAVVEEKPQAPVATPTNRQVETTRNAAPERYRNVGKDYTPNGLYRIVLQKPTSGNYGVQVALLSTYENALQKVADLQAQWFDNVLLSIEPGKGGQHQFKIILGPFDTEDAATAYQRSLRSRYNIQGFVVNLADLR